MPRLFFALIPTANAITAIKPLQHDLQRHIRGDFVRWVPEHQWHITTHFLGEQPERIADELADAVSLLPKTPITFTCWTLDVFPNRENPRTLVLRLADPSADGFKMHQAHYPIMLRAGVSPDTRPWKPHITLGRIRAGRSGFTADLGQIHVPQYTFSIEKIALFESILEGGVRYHQLARRFLYRA